MNSSFCIARIARDKITIVTNGFFLEGLRRNENPMG